MTTPNFDPNSQVASGTERGVGPPRVKRVKGVRGKRPEAGSARGDIPPDKK